LGLLLLVITQASNMNKVTTAILHHKEQLLNFLKSCLICLTNVRSIILYVLLVYFLYFLYYNEYN